MADNNSIKKITAKDVATFLADNPDSITDLLATHPKLLALYLAAAGDPAKDNKQIDPKVVDLSPALTFRARQDARKIKQTHESLLHVAAENMLSWTRILHAALGLLASTDLPGMCEVITKEFPVIFDLNQFVAFVFRFSALPVLRASLNLSKRDSFRSCRCVAIKSLIQEFCLDLFQSRSSIRDLT